MKIVSFNYTIHALDIGWWVEDHETGEREGKCKPKAKAKAKENA